MINANVYRVHFITNAGNDVYIQVVGLENANTIVGELRVLNIPAELDKVHPMDA